MREVDEKSSANPAAIRVLLVEDSLPVRQRIRSLIEESLPVEIVGETGTVADALILFAVHRPDAVILDLYLTDGNSLGAVTEIKRAHPGCVVIVLTNFAIPETRDHCFELGADYFFEKSREFERVPEVLARHKPILTDRAPGIPDARSFDPNAGNKDETGGHELTPRQRETITLLAEGKTNKEVAQILGISVRTAETHRANIFGRLGIDSLAGLVRYAIRHKFIEV